MYLAQVTWSDGEVASSAEKQLRILGGTTTRRPRITNRRPPTSGGSKTSQKLYAGIVLVLVALVGRL